MAENLILKESHKELESHSVNPFSPEFSFLSKRFNVNPVLLAATGQLKRTHQTQEMSVHTDRLTMKTL
jgi:hypothetical protein